MKCPSRDTCGGAGGALPVLVATTVFGAAAAAGPVGLLGGVSLLDMG